MSDLDYDDEHGDYCDCFECRLEDAIGNCHMFEDSGHWVCGAAGSEECDWDCPFSGDIGKKVEHTQEEQQ
jgi:hypothetical protein